MRYLCSAGASAGVLPLIKTIGIAPTNAIAAIISWIGFGLVVCTIRWGRVAREHVDERALRGMPTPTPEPLSSSAGDREKNDERIESSRRTSMTLGSDKSS
jgi:hypothetical protein